MNIPFQENHLGESNMLTSLMNKTFHLGESNMLTNFPKVLITSQLNFRKITWRRV